MTWICGVSWARTAVTAPSAVIGPGEFFGEMAIFNNKPRSASATVLEDCKVPAANRLAETVVERVSGYQPKDRLQNKFGMHLS